MFNRSSGSCQFGTVGFFLLLHAGGAAIFAAGGFPAFAWGFVVATVALHHGTFLINSLAHVWGARRFGTGDNRHINHHFCRSPCRQDLGWREVDVTYYILQVPAFRGLAGDLRPFRPPRTVGGHAR